MKKHLFLLAALLIGIVFAGAQNAPQDKQVSKMMDDLQQACQLTPDQSTKVLPMVQTFVDLRKQNRKKYAGDKASLKSADEDNRKNFMANLSSVLSPDQVTAYKQYMKQKRQERKAQRSAAPAGQ